jgi:hypothetical protein
MPEDTSEASTRCARSTAPGGKPTCVSSRSASSPGGTPSCRADEADEVRDHRPKFGGDGLSVHDDETMAAIEREQAGSSDGGIVAREGMQLEL